MIYYDQIIDINGKKKPKAKPIERLEGTNFYFTGGAPRKEESKFIPKKKGL